MRLRLSLVLACCPVLLAVACTSSTGGSASDSAPLSAAGSQPSLSTSPSAASPSVPSPSAASPSVPSSTAPSSISRSSGTATSTGVQAPSTGLATGTGVAAPPGCRSGHCERIATGDAGGGYTVTVYRGPSPSGSTAADYLALSASGRVVSWIVTDGYSPGQLACSPRPQPNCAVEDATGAHSSSARGYVVRGNRLAQFDEITTDTPVTDVLDLNGDGWIDVRAVQNDYQPDYTHGHVYWTTAVSDGRQFAVSGCSAKSRRLGPKPTAPLHRSCAH